MSTRPHIRPARLEDLPVLLDIYARARRYMAASGNPTQWGDSRPSPAQVEEDIRQGVCYVLEDQQGIQGVMALIFGEDPTYARIEGGSWLEDGPYATIHRMASTGNRPGVAATLFRWAFTQCPSIRIDTHAQNAPMRHVIEKAGFSPCGVITAGDGTPRLAYQKILHEKRNSTMKTVTVRGVEIGADIPKICAPIVGQTAQEILTAAAALPPLPVDVVEWRCDWFEGVFDPAQVAALLPQLRQALGELPLLLTFRTKAEGGQREISPSDYTALLAAAMDTGCVDLVDVELFMGEKTFRQLLAAAHQRGVYLIASNHDFQKTPPQEEIVARLEKMAELGADIAKMAVMPTCPQDVLTLLSATAQLKGSSPIPVVTMSMSGAGVISRLAGEEFGSALTFGAVGRSSAPGQIGVEELAETLNLLHRS